MVTLTIDDTSVTVEDGATILDAAKAANISIPTLCYFKGLCDIGACRVCCVEVEGDERLSAACNTPATEGMVVRTRSDRAEAARKTTLELIRITHCPVGALSERDDIARLRAAIADPEVTTVVQIAPATRTAWASSFGKQDGELGVERMCAALKEMGVDYVFDTVFAADLTIMEEGTELLNIVKAGETDRLPLFTSCCPGWVNFARTRYPESIAQHLSSAKSPMQMFGAVVKTWFAEKNGLAPEKIFSVALMPCTAKKVEVALPGMSSNPGVPDMDASLTTREFARMIAQSEIDVEALEDMPLDDPLDKGTGAGVIFGTTGGVMTAALRTAAAIMTGSNPEPTGFEFAPAAEGPWKELTSLSRRSMRARWITTSSK